jgi:transcriptional regulator with XRE-family HTH domain
MNDIYSRIDSLRRVRGVTLAHLNSIMPDGYRGKLTEYKNGKTSLTDADIQSIAEALDISVAYLKTGESPESEQPLLNPEYQKLTPKNRAAIDAAIAALLKSQQSDD